MKSGWLAVALLLVTVSCNPIEPEPEPGPRPEPQKTLYSLKPLAEMSLREKVGQLFNVRVEALDLTSTYTQTGP